MERRLERIHAALGELMAWHEPRALAIEQVYFGKNVGSAMAVGQASGVAMLAAAQRGITCFAYTPQAIKMAVCGSGAAGKEQVQRMVGTLLGLPEPPTPTTPPTRSPWRSATAAAKAAAGDRPASADARAASRAGWPDDRRRPRRGDGPPPRPRRHRRRRRRLPARGLLGDAEVGPGGRLARPSCTPS